MTLILNTKINPAREQAFAALLKTLTDAEGRPITEIEFRNLWLRNIAARGTVIADGWYNPPPCGAAVLLGDFSRISFTSLREKEFWPKRKNAADWENGCIYAYCSPVHIDTGIIGDISICLYLGSDKRLRDHFINAHIATAELLNRLSKVSNSKQLFELSQNVFYEYNLRNGPDSITDPLNNNIGHTLPSLGPLKAKYLTKEQKKYISNTRQFINGGAPFEFTDGMQFTIEPQLWSTIDPHQPKATFHYLVKKVPGGFHLCNDVDILFAKYVLDRER